VFLIEILLLLSFLDSQAREGKKVRKRTLANLSKLPDEVVDNMQLVLKGFPVVNQEKLTDICEVNRSLAHGHVAAVLGTIKQLNLPQLIEQKKTRQRDLVIAMIVSRIINPGSKLSTVRGIRTETTNSSLGKILGLEKADKNEYYQTLQGERISFEKITQPTVLQQSCLEDV
jgi:hypothetical protein